MAAERCPEPGFVFLDHAKSCYVKDLELLESLGVVKQGCVVVADNVIVPDVLTEYLDYVGAGRGLYETRLVEATFEYDQLWREGWEASRKDALAISVRIV